MRTRQSVILGLALAASTLAPSLALGIVNGELDAGRHPNVGLIAFGINNNQTVNPACSGTLIAPDVLLTAGHCKDEFDYYDSFGAISGLWVSFEDAWSDEFHPDRSNWVPVKEWHVHPDFMEPSFIRAFNDIAVLILDLANKPPQVVMPEPALLPTAGLLDDLAAQGGLHGQTLTAVGYGITRTFDPAPPFEQYQIYPTPRRVAISDYRALAQDRVYVSQNPTLGDGGICYGDSGGAYFLNVGGLDLLVALISEADTNCRSWGEGFRTDSETARTFLQQYMTLP